MSLNIQTQSEHQTQPGSLIETGGKNHDPADKMDLDSGIFLVNVLQVMFVVTCLLLPVSQIRTIDSAQLRHIVDNAGDLGEIFVPNIGRL